MSKSHRNPGLSAWVAVGLTLLKRHCSKAVKTPCLDDDSACLMLQSLFVIMYNYSEERYLFSALKEEQATRPAKSVKIDVKNKHSICMYSVLFIFMKYIMK